LHTIASRYSPSENLLFIARFIAAYSLGESSTPSAALDSPFTSTHRLLQNADDQEAKRIQFKLFPDRAEFYHWGQPFKREDVERITRLGDSDKPNEVHKIGSFGIGFKSVFAVTDRPKVYCKLDGQPFAFAIEDLLVPVALEPAAGQGEETLFVLPYAKKEGVDRSSEAAAQLIKAGPEVLMFLNHIEELAWEDSFGKGERCRCVRGAEGITVFERSEFGSEKEKHSPFVLPVIPATGDLARREALGSVPCGAAQCRRKSHR
jgi:hypothetical protein